MENNLIVTQNYIPPMDQSAIDKVRKLESFSLAMPQIDISTSHLIHAGMYARTIMIPANTMITGVLIKIATILIVQGDVIVYIGDKSIELHGYNVLAASPNRKQAFVAITDTYLTMIFPSEAKNTEKAEEEFTDDAGMLMSRNSENNHITITGE